MEMKTTMVNIFYKTVFNEILYRELQINTHFKINCRC